MPPVEKSRWSRPSSRKPSERASDLGIEVFVLMVIALLAAGWYILTTRYYFKEIQLIEVLLYTGVLVAGALILLAMAREEKKHSEETHPSVSLWISPHKDRRHVNEARLENAIVLGYSREGDPFYWTDNDRSLQGIIVGTSGAGKTTVQANIITQDIYLN